MHLIKLISVTLLSMVLTMVSAFILARFLSVEDRGLHQLFITSVSYVVTIATGGVGFALVLSMRNKQYQGWQGYLVAFLILSLVVACLALVLFDFTNYSVLFIVNVVLTAIATVTLEKSKSDPALRIYRKITLQQPILLVAVYGIAYLILKEQPLVIALYLFTLYSLVQALLCLHYLYQIHRGFIQHNPVQPIDKKFFFTTWFKQNLLQLFGATTVNLDKFLITLFMGNYVLGLYTVCIAFDSLLTRFINMLADYYYSGLINHLNRLKAVLVIVVLMSISAVILVPLLAELVIVFFFSAKYAEVAPILVWFIINSILAGLSWVLSQNMLLQGKQILLFTRQLISIVVFTLLFYVFREQQLYGVAYALIGASATRLVISIIYYFKYPITDLLNKEQNLEQKSAV
ncbi:lipopolysaccharide biosynthesis protein [Pasteurellaceae bacterium 22721_9_1]